MADWEQYLGSVGLSVTALDTHSARAVLSRCCPSRKTYPFAGLFGVERAPIQPQS